jgi:hypothetical protein
MRGHEGIWVGICLLSLSGGVSVVSDVRKRQSERTNQTQDSADAANDGH